MKKRHTARLSAALGAGILASLALIPEVRAEMVFENDPQPAAVNERVTNLRQSVQAENNATAQAAPAQIQTQVIEPQHIQAAPAVQVQAAPIQQVPVQQVPVQQVPVQQAPVQQQVYAAQVPSQMPVQAVIQQPVAAAAQVDVGPAKVVEDRQPISKSEMIRRARVRAELKNEDMLQERLEDLRLRDEQRRAEQLFGAQAQNGMPALNEAPAQVQQAPVVTQKVGQIAAQTAPAAQASPAGAAVAQDQLTTQASAATLLDSGERSIMMISPRFGLSEMKVDNGFDFRPRYSGGIAVGIATSDNLSFEVGYTYGEFGVAMVANAAYVAPQTEFMTLKKNVIDAGMKLHFLGPDAKLRPFIGGGLAYDMSYLNYGQQYLAYLNSNPAFAGMAQDNQLSSYEGYLSGGLDLKVSKSIYVGALFKYYNTLSSRQTSSLNGAAIYGYYTGTTVDPTKQYISNSIAGASFYTLQGAVSFLF